MITKSYSSIIGNSPEATDNSVESEIEDSCCSCSSGTADEDDNEE